ncbi:formyltransferase family protein [Gramella sp. MAR_2010_147]|uniref:formyltransferase family protein n=1 Tax=Gramella sp. MAR_2010_147 TaxID=1250205 RepID=UPI00087B3D2F|nr:formyltransferase family protein [Gramella sp. MAR_2010_147]SDR69656.1 methionyl-tRNA formyltransferase [Gramella sp. MAR_2010_147]
MTFVLVTEKIWHINFFEILKEESEHSWFLINSKKEFNIGHLREINPDKIFIPHWSYIIKEEIFSNYECIVFHMTDLPYGRGGSPLQNLIVRGHSETKVSALKVTKGIDEGDIYLKRDLNLNGTAEEIFMRCSKVIFEMIDEIIFKAIKPIPQIGDIVNFKRRTPDQSDLSNLKTLEDIFNYIRMLDAEQYPKAFLETETLKFEFSRASYKSDKSIIADVRITKK